MVCSTFRWRTYGILISEGEQGDYAVHHALHRARDVVFDGFWAMGRIVANGGAS